MNRKVTSDLDRCAANADGGDAMATRTCRKVQIGETSSLSEKSIDSSKSNSASSSGHKSSPSSAFSGGWQTNNDLPDRRLVVRKILALVKKKNGKHSDDSTKLLDMLPKIARKMEEHLYRSATTKEEYLDRSTLKYRLQEMVNGLEIHRSTLKRSSPANATEKKFPTAMEDRSQVHAQ